MVIIKMMTFSQILLFLALTTATIYAQETGSDMIQKKDQSFEGLGDLLTNMVSLDNTELIFISDFTLPQQVKKSYEGFELIFIEFIGSNSE